MLTNEQRATVLRKGEEWHGSLSFAVDSLRKRIRQVCEDPAKPLPKYRVDDILAYVLTRAIVENTCVDVIEHLAEKMEAAVGSPATAHEPPAAPAPAATERG